MTDTLSPAAQTVLDAGMEYSGPAFEPLVRKMTAAVLRSAADQILTIEWVGRIPLNTTHTLGINSSRDALHAIAAELEGNQ